jgi:hypothetical protein
MISARPASRKVISETVKNANEQCAQENKQYLFVKNIFRHSNLLGAETVSYDLYFFCVEAGDPRLMERKPSRQPVAEKGEQTETRPKQTEPQKRPDLKASPPPGKGAPDKKAPPAQEQAVPGKETAEEKPADSPGKEAAPVPQKPPPAKDDTQEKQESDAKISEEQQRKGNPGMGAPEDLRKDGSSLYEEPEQNIRIIEEPLTK